MKTPFVTLSNGLADLVVAGVTRRLRYLPNQISTADLPISFVRLPDGQESALTADGIGGWPTRTVELVIAVEPLGQSGNEANHAATLALMDAVDTALRATVPGVWYTGKIAWTMRASQSIIGQTEFWTIIVRVSARG